MDSRQQRAAELRAKRERLEELRRAKAEAEAAHEARFGRVSQASEPGRDGQLPMELEELFGEALRRRVATQGSIDTMRRHIATGACPSRSSRTLRSRVSKRARVHAAFCVDAQVDSRRSTTSPCGAIGWVSRPGPRGLWQPFKRRPLPAGP
jgi:hypothetical protein